jgi:xanthine/CO dehydrogenase XdhC/CoxF family maturation factor
VSARQILESFDRWRAARVPLALVTVVETEGSTYTKAGHRILIAADGGFQGLVSGGCLEGDLAEHAREVLAAGTAQVLTYDLRDDDGLFDLGIGCNGLFRVLLQPLEPDAGYAPFGAIAACLRGDVAGVTATVVESADPALPVGATFVACGDTPLAWRLPPAWRDRLEAACAQRRTEPRAALVTEPGAASARVLYAPLRPLPRLLVLGGGLDAVPLVGLAQRVGWRITVADHRPGYLARGDLGAADERLQIAPAELARALPLARYAAAVVMSHHLETDRGWLRALAASPVPYVGLLGPAARRERLLADLGREAELLQPRLRAPVGLPIGTDSPESIALAILAEIHATLAGRVELLARGGGR